MMQRGRKRTWNTIEEVSEYHANGEEITKELKKRRLLQDRDGIVSVPSEASESYRDGIRNIPDQTSHPMWNNSYAAINQTLRGCHYLREMRKSYAEIITAQEHAIQGNSMYLSNLQSRNEHCSNE